MNIFEIGTVFNLGGRETGTHEQDNLCITLSNIDADFTKIKQVLDYISSNLDIKLILEAEKNQSFVNGRTAKIKHKGKTIGVIGELKPEVLTKWEIEMPTAALELNITELIEHKA